jgi:nucleoid DNA-binding protein
MQELITKLTTNAGISEEQAKKVLDTVKDYVKEKFPIMADAVNKLFEGGEKREEDDYL